MTDVIITDIENIVTEIKDEFKTVEVKAEAITDAEIQAFVAYVKTNLGPDIMALAKALIAGFVAGSPWGPLEDALITQAATLGKTLLKGEATVALNTAQTLLFAAAPSAPVVTAPAV